MGEELTARNFHTEQNIDILLSPWYHLDASKVKVLTPC